MALAGLKARLRELPISLADKIAKRAAPALTDMTQSAYGGNRNVYGDPRPKSVDGTPLTLEKSGKTRRTATFTSDGRIVRAVLGTPWAKFLIGRYRILPNGGMPVEWKRAIDNIVHTTKSGVNK